MRCDVEEKGLAVCGLACMLCSVEGCQGCKMRGCKDSSDCSVYNCATGKGLDGCYQCEDFPCEEKMLSGIRNRAFNRYARQYGKQALIDRLRINAENGIVYHRPDGLMGDYDTCETEQEVLDLLNNGRPGPYDVCPTYESEHFLLRLVSLEDATDLLKCYQDPKARMLFNADTCNTDFCFETLEELRNYIAGWLKAYENEEFVRFSIVDKSIGKAVGTIEIFGMVGAYHSPLGILRLDICSEYEQVLYLEELFTLCVKEFFPLFGMDRIMHKAVPAAAGRISVLQKLGFEPCELPGRAHSWILYKSKHKK